MNIDKQHGTAMVEFAILLPLLLLLVFGMTEFGRMLYTKSTLTHAAREGVRRAVVTPAAYANASTSEVVKRISPSATVVMTPNQPSANSTVKVSVTTRFKLFVVPNLMPVLNKYTTLHGEATMRYER